MEATPRLSQANDHLEKVVEQNTDSIAQLREELDDLYKMVLDLTHDAQRQHDNERHEREKIVLRLENELLRFERRLPSPRES